jgi:hypothetical protein
MSFLRDPKRLFATILAGVAGILVLVATTAQVPLLDLFADTVMTWAATLTALALLVGVVSVAASHVARVASRSADWGYSLLLILSMLVVILSGTLFGVVADADGVTKVVVFPTTLVEQPVRDIFRAIYQPLASSFLALLTFFSLSAVLRAVRHRTADALVITVIALLVLVSSAVPPDSIPLLGEGVQWASEYLALAGARALLIGGALGAVIAGVRVLLGFDQPFLDR